MGCPRKLSMFENGDGGGASVVHQPLSGRRRVGQRTDPRGEHSKISVFTFTQIGFQRVSDQNRADFCESRYITSFLRDPLDRGDRLGWLFDVPGREATATR